MDSCYTSSLMPLSEGLARLTDAITAVTEIETVPLQAADGRIISAPIICPVNVPPADNSAMDGYALRAVDAPEAATQLQLIGRSMAGVPYHGTVNQGECVRIMTGAVIPQGATAVVMQEQVVTNDESITFKRPVQIAQNIRRAGEDLKQGQLLFEQGHRLRPADLGLLASIGIGEVALYRKPRVALISNGDELIEPGRSLKAGQIYESNRYALAALVRRLPIIVEEFGIIPDQPEALREAMTKAGRFDAVISSGGVSVGDADYIKIILDELGEIDFWKLAIKPGKPFAFGSLGNAHYFGLPGNPVSAMVTCHQLAIPALRRLTGEHYVAPTPLVATTTGLLRKRPGRLDFQRGRYQNGPDGKLLVSATGAQGSGVMSSFCEANCYIVLEQERGSVEQGEQVEILPFDALMV
ncbi:molybdopterin molybdotransferase MoeA [Echinimonas agarilytica]|uniref:Molybdopterin molybdenumtransferase n=1 Tax=Echinimonas agarilytica TaxID=1215918 RepID=A0AA42B946_9GAMM|nr:gephyrin-like molybdotransferase Glp [Echinimonas agarilytica]MCM2681203.1 molybdopterin molybdotransferase MoeA [Echinimonas agarilytica]